MPLTEAKRKLLEQAYRAQIAAGEEPNHERARLTAGCKWKSAKRAWEGGIRQLLQAEQVQLSAAEELRRKALSATATEQAAAQIVSESALVRDVYTASRALMAVLATAFPAFKQLAADLTAAVQDPNNPLKKDAAAATHVLRQFVMAVSRTATIAATAQQMERLRTGDPSAVIKVEHELVNATPEQAKAKAEEVLQLAERLKQLQAADQKEEPDGGGGLLN